MFFLLFACETSEILPKFLPTILRKIDELIRRYRQTKFWEIFIFIYFAGLRDFLVCWSNGGGYSDIRRDDHVLQVRGNAGGRSQ